MVHNIYSTNSFFVSSRAKCIVYNASINKYLSPAFDDNFLAGLETLSDDIQAYYEFIDEFGTHYVNSIHMGASFGYTFKLSSSSKKNFAEKKVDIEAEASAHAFVATISVSAK
jgi:hypothetical protein